MKQIILYYDPSKAHTNADVAQGRTCSSLFSRSAVYGKTNIILYQQTEAVTSTRPAEALKAAVTLVLRDYFTQSCCPLK